MTMTLVPDDDRPTPRVANLAARTGTGHVLYPPEFWMEREPEPLVDRLAPAAGIVIGLALAGVFYFGVWGLSLAVWP